MQDHPEFDSTQPVDPDVLTDEERATVVEGMRRRRGLQAVEDELPELRFPHSPPK